MNHHELTFAYIAALTGNAESVIDWRVIHDRDRGVQGVNLRGTYRELSDTLHTYNSQGYGVFCNINELDGMGNLLTNVRAIRTHVVDLDDPATSRMNYDRAVASEPRPHFAVQTSPDKFHLYWLVEPYAGNDFYTLHQRKLAQFYQGDKSINDATRVLRVPGFCHMKGEPFLVNCWGVGNQPRYSADHIQQCLSAVNILEHSVTRFELGTPDMQAPSLEWLQYALKLADPNEMSYEEWMSFTAAFKQAGWSHAEESVLYNMWSQWCAGYSGNNDAENLKLWKSHKDTQIGWKNIVNRLPHLKAVLTFGYSEPQQAQPNQPVVDTAQQFDERDSLPEILDGHQCSIWFRGCWLVAREGKVFTEQGRYLNASQFNALFGSKHFIITSTGKTTDEPWKAALRSTVWTIPKVDHVRFLPDQPSFAIIEDSMKRKGINTYIAPEIDAREGDITLWHDHMVRILPNADDRKIFEDYFAHCIKFPGYKIQYAPLLQSAEGIGKSAFYEIMSHALGKMYVYRPKAPELVSSGSKFNAWMRGKLAIMVDEIKIDERRELIEILKPMITDSEIEIQSKGVDQDMEDNVANWLFFSNYKDAIPINKNGRRYAIFYSALQSEHDILTAGMDKAYFDRFWTWLREGGGLQAITYYYRNYPIEKGDIPVRAPRTSSYEEALKISRSPVEVIVQDAVEDGLTGFRAGFVSIQAALNRSRNAGVRNANARTIQTVLENMGYFEIGKTASPVVQEDPQNRSVIYSRNAMETVENYMVSQGYVVA